jgi:hypothetical protein
LSEVGPVFVGLAVAIIVFAIAEFGAGGASFSAATTRTVRFAFKDTFAETGSFAFLTFFTDVGIIFVDLAVAVVVFAVAQIFCGGLDRTLTLTPFAVGVTGLLAFLTDPIVGSTFALFAGVAVTTFVNIAIAVVVFVVTGFFVGFYTVFAFTPFFSTVDTVLFAFFAGADIGSTILTVAGDTDTTFVFFAVTVVVFAIADLGAGLNFAVTLAPFAFVGTKLFTGTTDTIAHRAFGASITGAFATGFAFEFGAVVSIRFGSRLTAICNGFFVWFDRFLFGGGGDTFVGLADADSLTVLCLATFDADPFDTGGVRGVAVTVECTDIAAHNTGLQPTQSEQKGQATEEPTPHSSSGRQSIHPKNLKCIKENDVWSPRETQIGKEFVCSMTTGKIPALTENPAVKIRAGSANGTVLDRSGGIFSQRASKAVQVQIAR